MNNQNNQLAGVTRYCLFALSFLVLGVVGALSEVRVQFVWLMILVAVVMMAMAGRTWYLGTDHVKCPDRKALRPDARIQNVEHREVGIARNGEARIRTVVTFDDGFRFISHRTNVKNTGMGTYTIQTGPKENTEILARAMQEHLKALIRK